MAVSGWAGFKAADMLLWNPNTKFIVWEKTEREFWKINGYPKHLKPSVKFESVIHPGTIFSSYVRMHTSNVFETPLNK